MKTKWLFPHWFQLIGWFAFSGFAGFWLLASCVHAFMPSVANELTERLSSTELGRFDIDEIISVGCILSLLFINFSREKVEDEMISQLRLEALQWSVYVNYSILMIAILTIYDAAFFGVMVYNMFTILIIFLIRFRYTIYRLNRAASL